MTVSGKCCWFCGSCWISFLMLFTFYSFISRWWGLFLDIIRKIFLDCQGRVIFQWHFGDRFPNSLFFLNRRSSSRPLVLRNFTVQTMSSWASAAGALVIRVGRSWGPPSNTKFRRLRLCSWYLPVKFHSQVVIKATKIWQRAVMENKCSPFLTAALVVEVLGKN